MPTVTDRITKTPGVCGGDACIHGTRIPVWSLVEARRLGSSNPRLLESYPSLTLADLDAAWEYARSHALEVERDIWENQAVMEDQGGDRRLALIVRGWQLGLSDETIAEAFSPPLTAHELPSARREYLARKDAFEAAMPALLPEELREALVTAP